MLGCIPLVLCQPLQEVLECAFRKYSALHSKWLGLEFIINMGTLIIVALILGEFHYDILIFKETSFEETKALLHCARHCNYHSVYYSMLNCLVWLRLVYLLRLNRILGPLIKIITRMTQDILKFMFLLALIILTFACVGNIEFSVPEFYTFHQSIITLYSWMLGEFSFDTMQPEGAPGYLYLAFYLMLNLILLLNFVIAILSSTYSRLERHGVGLYLESLLDEIPKWAFQPDLNVLTYRVPPCNLLSLLLFPCLRPGPSSRFRPRAPRLALLLEAFFFLPAFVFALLAVLLLDLLAAPFVYLLLLHRFCGHASSRGLAFLSLLAFPLLVLPFALLDVVLAAIHLWSRPSLPLNSHHQHGSRVPPARLLLKRDLATLERVLLRDYSQCFSPSASPSDPSSESLVPLFELVYRVREELPFTCNFHDLARIVASSARHSTPFDPLPPPSLSPSLAPSLSPIDSDNLDQSLDFLIGNRRKKSSSRLKSFKSSISSSPPLRRKQYLSSPYRPSVDEVTRFNALKTFLADNSFQGRDAVLYIFPGLLLQALQEVRLMQSIATDASGPRS